ncbi:phytoene/squalene synthase family protein [Alicyclobacillus fastidiosus]|uniref:Phytoene/squalene synthase family protein n=1 Tax=Alicyclobacillus fastidiosus TaxID=392011 RepID=A0ABY6ZKV5_9BACL|nr:phytoene/squalene synthase family protein [Alicyclobacillus fastidiosus]WAH42734.1 phytoene/squalene synthase family protein [Alicyclobacillus fastidiosus]GMA64635.1 phytoene desaturase [Alicyclobacillus fastidiosus]
MNLTQAYKFCAKATRQAGSSFYYGMRLLPKEKRMAMYAIYAWSRICDDAVDEFRGEAAKDQLHHAERIFLEAYEPAYSSHSNPVVQALGDAVRRFHIPKDPFVGLLEGMRMDMEPVRFGTFAELEQYCEYVAGTVGEVCIYIFGYHDPVAFQWAREMGVALQLTNILRDLKEDILRDRVYLPLEEMRRVGYSLEDLVHQRKTPAFYALMDEQTRRARDYFERARNLFPLVEVDSLRCLRVLYLMYYEILDKIQENGFNVFEERIHVSGSRKLQLVWGALWNAHATV